MAETRASPEMTPQIWDDQFSTEYFQQNAFAKYMGTGDNNPIRIKEDFASKRGNGITFSFVTNLTRGTIFDRQPLRGHEDLLGEYGDKVNWRLRKKGISIHELDADLDAIDLRKAARGALKTWATEDVKWETIDRLGDVGTNCDVPFASATAADKNNWVTNNADRVLFGNGTANYSTTFATAAGNVDATNDKLTKENLSLLKRVALTASPRITPLTTADGNRRTFVAFVHPFVMRDFVASLTTTETQVSLQDKNNNLFMGGDRDWDGVVVHEVDDMPIYTDIGAGGTVEVSPVYLLGQEALGYALKSRYASRTQTDDYDQVEGIGMIGKWGMKKLCYSANITAGGQVSTALNKQRGVVTGFFAAMGD